jgi:hypothetical protein
MEIGRIEGQSQQTVRRDTRPIEARAPIALFESPAIGRKPLTSRAQPSLDLASFTIATSVARSSSAVVTGLANATRTGRGPSVVFADISKPYRSTPVIVADVVSVAFENALH